MYNIHGIIVLSHTIDRSSTVIKETSEQRIRDTFTGKFHLWHQLTVWIMQLNTKHYSNGQRRFSHLSPSRLPNLPGTCHIPVKSVANTVFFCNKLTRWWTLEHGHSLWESLSDCKGLNLTAVIQCGKMDVVYFTMYQAAQLKIALW